MIIRLAKVVLIAVLALTAVSACGFNLRGGGATQSGSQVVGRLHLDGDSAVSVLRPLRNALTAQQVQFAAFREDADTLVIIDNEVLSRRVASVDASGRVSEFELLHSIDLRTVRTVDGVKAVRREAEDSGQRPLTVSVIRDYTYDETEVLAKDDEERILRAEMSDELVRHLVLRIFAGSI